VRETVLTHEAGIAEVDELVEGRDDGG